VQYDGDFRTARDELTDKTVTASLFDENVLWENYPLENSSPELKVTAVII
jgi:hypothetical protein